MFENTPPLRFGKSLDGITHCGPRDHGAVFEYIFFQAPGVRLAGFAQEPAAGFVHQVMGIGEQRGHDPIDPIQMPAFTGALDEHYHPGAAEPQVRRLAPSLEPFSEVVEFFQQPPESQWIWQARL